MHCAPARARGRQPAGAGRQPRGAGPLTNVLPELVAAAAAARTALRRCGTRAAPAHLQKTQRTATPNSARRWPKLKRLSTIWRRHLPGRTWWSARAGALTVAELSAVRGCPAVLVPFPLAIDDHQSKNARLAGTTQGAAVLIKQQDELGCTVAAPSCCKQLTGDRPRLKNDGDGRAPRAGAARGCQSRGG